MQVVNASLSGNSHSTSSAQGALLKQYYSTTESANDVVNSLKALGNYVPGGQIGGDIFANSTKILPDVPGRVWYEADIGLNNSMSRAKQPGTRLLYSNDGLTYVTSNHYDTAEALGIWNCCKGG